MDFEFHYGVYVSEVNMLHLLVESALKDFA